MKQSNIFSKYSFTLDLFLNSSIDIDKSGILNENHLYVFIGNVLSTSRKTLLHTVT